MLDRADGAVDYEFGRGKMTTKAEKRWSDHSSFQQELAEYVGWAVIATGPVRVEVFVCKSCGVEVGK